LDASESASFRWPEDLESLLGEIQRAVESLCRHYRAEEHMADVAQVVVLRLWQARERLRFSNRRALFGYVQQVALHEIPAQLRAASGCGRLQTRDPSALAETALARAGPDPELPPMEELLGLLGDPRQREAVRLRYAEGLTLEKVGERMGEKTSTVHLLINRALDNLSLKLAGKRREQR
jgi:RNA polymerase sigma factor (sigma-70 family)